MRMLRLPKPTRRQLDVSLILLGILIAFAALVLGQGDEFMRKLKGYIGQSEPPADSLSRSLRGRWAIDSACDSYLTFDVRGRRLVISSPQRPDFSVDTVAIATMTGDAIAGTGSDGAFSLHVTRDGLDIEDGAGRQSYQRCGS